MDMEDSLYDIEMSDEEREILVEHIYTLYNSFTATIPITEDETLGEYEEEKQIYELESFFRP